MPDQRGSLTDMLVRSKIAALAVSLVLASSGAFAQTAPPAVAPAEALASPSGLAWIVLTPPTGDASPSSSDHVTLDYIGWTVEGKVLDSTEKHPDVRTFELGKLSAGLQESVASMKPGEKRRVWMPAELGPKKTAAIFDVALLEISRPLDAPADVAAPPAEAERTRSGIASQMLKAGTGTTKPKAKSFVVVQYTGWTTDGKVFDSTFRSGQPGYFRLDEVIPGWREGLQLMVAGERRRFWIPEKLAYRGQRGMPQGMLVFDIELLRFH